MSHKKLNTRIVIFIVLLVSSAALFFGIEQGINSVTVNTEIDKNIYFFSAQIITLFFFFGCLLGVIIFAILARYVGRRRTFFIILIYLFLIVFLNLLLKDCAEVLWILRVLMGSAAGGISFLVPIYIAEISPVSKRGGYIAIYELMISIGILVVVIFVYFNILLYLTCSYYVFIPMVIISLLSYKFLIVSESWNYVRNIKRASLKNTAYLTFLDFKGYRFAILRVIGLGIALQAVQQLSGINAMIYFSVDLFSAAGISNPLFTVAAVISIKTVATLFTVNIIDYFGRKNLLYFGFILMGFTLLFSCILFHNHNLHGTMYIGRKIGILFCSLLYFAAYAMSIGPIAWVLCAEVFPLQYKEMGIGISTCTNWIFNAFIIFFCYYFVEEHHISILLLVFSICCFAGIAFTAIFIPETKNVSLKSIEKKLYSGNKLRDIGESSNRRNEYT